MKKVNEKKKIWNVPKISKMDIKKITLSGSDRGKEKNHAARFE